MDTILRSLVPTPDNYLPKAIVFPNSSYFAGKDAFLRQANSFDRDTFC